MVSAFFALIFFGLCNTVMRASAQTPGNNETVSAIDQRIVYLGDWTVVDNGGHMFTSVSGSFALNFTGSAIYWSSRKLYNGANLQVTVDNSEPTFMDLSQGLSPNAMSNVEVLFAQEGLDGLHPHIINVTWLAPGSNEIGSFLENYFLQYVG